MPVPGCSQPPVTLTSTDLSYLRAIYGMNPTLSPQTQMNVVAAQMAKEAGAR